jgi:hypothetical protein
MRSIQKYLDSPHWKIQLIDEETGVEVHEIVITKGHVIITGLVIELIFLIIYYS